VIDYNPTLFYRDQLESAVVPHIDYEALLQNPKALNAAAAHLSVADLLQLTEAMYTTIDSLIAECVDADVTFQPIDPHASDTAAASAAEMNLAWTLGHVVVHLTAGNEESAALAAEQARGVPFHGRSRYETPWETVTTIAACRRRLEESKRMCLGGLAMWPDEPHVDITTEVWPGGPVVDARGRYMVGLFHAYSHLNQIRDIAEQARAAR
jgi:hypothetical protein